MSSVIDHYEDILSHDGWIKIRGRKQVQLESDFPHKTNGIIWFYYMRCDIVALWKAVDWYISAAHVIMEF